SFSIAPGQLVGLIGPNGAGKSTLVKAMLGLIPTASGFVRFNQRPLKQQRQQVAYIPQRSQIDWDYPVSVNNVVLMGRTFFLGLFSRISRQSQQLAEDALKRVGMWELRHRQIGELSGGQQQRVFIARAIAQQAEIFLFDEPLIGIDKKTEALIFEVFSDLKAESKTLLVSSHQWGQDLAKYDSLLLLNQQLVAIGIPQEVMTIENIQRAYGQGISNPAKPSLETLYFC
ncbi:MAG: metal ABC transporter ATP-binding protein, partial [Crinalium sp.]